jgi:hypothetical protein
MLRIVANFFIFQTLYTIMVIVFSGKNYCPVMMQAVSRSLPPFDALSDQSTHSWTRLECDTVYNTEVLSRWLSPNNTAAPEFRIWVARQLEQKCRNVVSQMGRLFRLALVWPVAMCNVLACRVYIKPNANMIMHSFAKVWMAGRDI